MTNFRSDARLDDVKSSVKIKKVVEDGKYEVRVFDLNDVYIGTVKFDNGCWRLVGYADSKFESTHLLQALKRVFDIHSRFNSEFLDVERQVFTTNSVKNLLKSKDE